MPQAQVPAPDLTTAATRTRQGLAATKATRMNSSSFLRDPFAIGLMIGSLRWAARLYTYTEVTAVSSTTHRPCGWRPSGRSPDIVDRRHNIIQEPEKPSAHRGGASSAAAVKVIPAGTVPLRCHRGAVGADDDG